MQYGSDIFILFDFYCNISREGKGIFTSGLVINREIQNSIEGKSLFQKASLPPPQGHKPGNIRGITQHGNLLKQMLFSNLSSSAQPVLKTSMDSYFQTTNWFRLIVKILFIPKFKDRNLSLIEKQCSISFLLCFAIF